MSRDDYTGEGRKQHPLRRQAFRDAAGMRQDIERLLLDAKRADLMEQAASMPLWTEFIRPLLEENGPKRLDNLGRETLSGAEFEKVQHVALQFEMLLDYLDELPGNGAEYRSQAEELSRKLEQMAKDGLIDREAPE